MIRCDAAVVVYIKSNRIELKSGSESGQALYEYDFEAAGIQISRRPIVVVISFLSIGPLGSIRSQSQARAIRPM